MSGTPAARLLHDLYKGPKRITDPGNAGIIRATKDLQICEMVSGASNETRTLAPPSKAGIRLVLRMMTDGGGDIVVTAAAGYNIALETKATFADASDFLSLVSVTLVPAVGGSGATYRWEALEGNLGTVIASASTSSSPSSTPSASSSSSPSASTSPSASASSSPSASTSPSASASSSPSTSPSAT